MPATAFYRLVMFLRIEQDSSPVIGLLSSTLPGREPRSNVDSFGDAIKFKDKQEGPAKTVLQRVSGKKRAVSPRKLFVNAEHLWSRQQRNPMILLLR
jgi:hypothetical protein